MRYRKTNFASELTARWATFFDIAGWSWTYRPKVKGAQPEFKVEFPCGHSECGPTHTLYVMVRPFATLSMFYGTEALKFERKHFYGDGLDADAVALFGSDPNATGWAMGHGAGGSFLGEDESGLSAGDSVGVWVPKADELWERAGEKIKTQRCLTAKEIHCTQDTTDEVTEALDGIASGLVDVSGSLDKVAAGLNAIADAIKGR
jgi:hypothetical protein